MAAKKGSKRQPWEQVCDVCGKVYMTACYTSHRCQECMKEKRRAENRAWAKTPEGKACTRRKRMKYKRLHPERVKATRKRAYEANKAKEREACKRWEVDNRERVNKLQKMRRRRLAGDIKAFFELAKELGRLKTCPRTHTTSLTLPCGQLEQCWGATPCEKTFGLVKPNFSSRRFHGLYSA